MLFTLGKKDKERQDALGWLLSCHQKIRDITALTKRLVSAEAASLSEIPEAAERAHRYFTIALPLHERDEEDSLFPRLFGREPTLDQALLTMKEDHQSINEQLSGLVPALARLIQAPSSLLSLRADLTLWVERLSALWETHLTREERIIFPAAERFLSLEELATILEEMKERRHSK